MRKDKVITKVLGEEVALSPSDICNRRFKRALIGGYKRGEVQTFLERVSDVVESLLSQVRTLKEKQEEQKALLEEYREMEATLRSALISSRKFSESIIDTAKREAHTLVEEARLARAQAQLGAAKLPAELSRDIMLLERQRQRLRAEMAAILETHKGLLDSLIPETSRQTPASLFEVAGSARDEEPADAVAVDGPPADVAPDEAQPADPATSEEPSSDPAVKEPAE